MNTEIKISLLTVERDRLKEMIEELENKSNFVWGRERCSVCKEAKRVKSLGQRECMNCNLLGVATRCGYIEDFRDQAGTYDGEVDRNIYNEKEVEYMQDLFANYIRQIDEEIEELK